MPAGKPEKEAEARGPELRPRVLGGEEIVYSKQNRSLRCVYTEIGRNIFYRFFYRGAAVEYQRIRRDPSTSFPRRP